MRYNSLLLPRPFRTVKVHLYTVQTRAWMRPRPQPRIGLIERKWNGTVYTYCEHKRTRILVRANSRRECLSSNFLCDYRTNCFILSNHSGFFVMWRSYCFWVPTVFKYDRPYWTPHLGSTKKSNIIRPKATKSAVILKIRKRRKMSGHRLRKKFTWQVNI